MLYEICQRPIVVLCFFLCILFPVLAYSDIEEIKARGKLRIGVCATDQPPFYYHNANGELVGLEIDITRAISHELRVEPEFIVDREKWDEVVQDVVSGRTDIATSEISRTPQRSITTSFSTPYVEIKMTFIFNRLLLIKAFKNGIYTLKQMFSDEQFTLVTTAGSSYDSIAKRIFHDKGAVNSLDKYGDDLNKVLAGQELASFTNEVIVGDKILNNPEARLHTVSYPISGYVDQIAIPVSYENPKLLSLINSIIKIRKLKYSGQDIIQELNNVYTERNVIR